ncbi:hypothetical protein ACRRTK_014479 [Alexandromys fortis]
MVESMNASSSKVVCYLPSTQVSADETLTRRKKEEEEEREEEEKEEGEEEEEQEKEEEKQEKKKEKEEGWHIKLILSNLQGAGSHNDKIPLWFQNLLCALWLLGASWPFSTLSVCSQLLSGLSFLPHLFLQIPLLCRVLIATVLSRGAVDVRKRKSGGWCHLRPQTKTLWHPKS